MVFGKTRASLFQLKNIHLYGIILGNLDVDNKHNLRNSSVKGGALLPSLQVNLAV